MAKHRGFKMFVADHMLRWYIFAVSFASVVLEASGDCPERCVCHLDQVPSTVVCVKQGLNEFPDNLSDSVQHLDLSGNVLEELSDRVTLYYNLEYLNLARNRLAALPSNLQTLSKLERLDLSGNSFTSVSEVESISQLASLKILYFSGNPISSLDGLTSPSLQALDFSHCMVKEFVNVSLSGLPVLSTLSLAGNPIRLMQNPKSISLRWLDVSDCRLNYLEPDTLRGLPNLEELRLSNNPTLVFSTRYDTLTHGNLKRLDVSRCNLDRPGLHGFPMLTHAKLSRNMIRLLPNQIFAKNKELQQITLAGNGLDVLNKTALAGLAKLEILDLSSNSLQNIHWGVLKENVNLKLVNLSYNSLFEFPNLTTSTSLLDLSANLITNFKSDVLSAMPNLRTLNLGNNRVIAIPDHLESPSLTSLSLKQNRLVELNNESFDLLPNLVKIDLSGNRLTAAPPKSVFSENPLLQRIYLEDNPWRCDCEHIYDIYVYLTEPPGKTSGQSLICQSPSNISGFSWESACHDTWTGPNFNSKDKAWGMILVSILTMVIVFGSIVSLRHAMKMKRQAHLERQELERAEARERLRLLQRRTQTEEEFIEQPPVPRVNPLELIGPPSYEEAVHMPRLAHSMDGLDTISMESGPTHFLGSVDNLRSKKRRTRRPRKRTLSDENLAKREERREIRRRRASLERNQSTNDLGDSAQSPLDSTTETTANRTLLSRRPKIKSDSQSDEGAKTRPRPLTPAARHKKRRGNAKNGHSSDDEDSDANNGIVPNIVYKSNSGLVIKSLAREPRSGYRPTAPESDF